MMLNVFKSKEKLKAITAFLNHYFEDHEEWKNGVNTEINLCNEDNFSIDIYDGHHIYESWTYEDILDYLNRNRVSYE